MGGTKKITIEIPADLLERAQEASKVGIAETVCAGLKLLAASNVYERVRQMRGKAAFRLAGKS